MHSDQDVQLWIEKGRYLMGELIYSGSLEQAIEQANSLRKVKTIVSEVEGELLLLNKKDMPVGIITNVPVKPKGVRRKASKR
jgi:hypothetical protein